MTLTLRTTRSLSGARSIINQAARYLPVVLLTLAVLSLTQLTVFAGTINSFGPANPGGCITTFPSPSTLGNAFEVSLPPSDCVLSYNWSGDVVTSYPLTFNITNNTGQVMTDLHVDLLTSLLTDLPFFSSGGVISGPLVLVGQTSSTLDFNWVSTKLPNGGAEKISVNLTLPRVLKGSLGNDLIIITPTFGSAATTAPEPTSLTLGLSGAFLVGLGAWRRRRPSDIKVKQLRHLAKEKARSSPPAGRV